MKITRRNGIAGQVQYTALIADPDEGPRTVSFVGSTYGGPIVMVTGSGVQTFVSNPERYGSTLDESWVRAFLAD